MRTDRGVLTHDVGVRASRHAWILRWAIILGLVFGIASASVAQDTDWSAIIEEAAPAIVQVYMDGRPSGSGVIISPLGYVLTAEHVVRNADHVSVVFNGEEHAVEWLVDEPDADMALLWFRGRELPHLPLRMADPPVRFHEEMASLGFGMATADPRYGVGLIVRVGHVQGFRINENGYMFIQHTAHCAYGDSGGPLINEDGEVVGITSGYIPHRTKTQWGTGDLVRLYDIAAAVTEMLSLFPDLHTPPPGFVMPLLTLRHTSFVNSVVFSPRNEGLLASGTDDGAVQLWNTSTGDVVETFLGHTGRVRSVAFSPDGALLASGSDDSTVMVWDVTTGQEIATFQGHTDWVRSVAFSPDGTLLASCSDDRTVKLWNLDSAEPTHTLYGHDGYVQSVAFCREGRMLASGSDDTTVRIWSVETGEVIDTVEVHTDRVTSVSFSPDGALLASGSHDRTVRLWNVAAGEVVSTFEGHKGGVSSVAFSPDGALLASGSHERTVKLWDVTTGELVDTFREHTDRVSSVAFSKDGRLLSSGSQDATVMLWRMNSGE